MARLTDDRRPVYGGDFPDPFVLATGDGYRAFGTQSGGVNVQVLASADLAAWTARPDALPHLPEWAAPGRTWSPAVLARPGGFVLYCAVRHAAADRQAIAVAWADDPGGPYTAAARGPLVFQAERGGSIDPSPFVDADGAAYLVWRSDDNAVGRPPSLWGAPLRPDGLELAGPPVELLRHDAPWERPLVEAPSLARVGAGVYVLFYSGGWWESDGYAVGYAVGEAPLGPFRKVTVDGPWLASGPGRAGPGGAEVFRTAGGEWALALHAWTPPAVRYEAGGRRSLWIERLTFAGDRPQIS
ncbi:MAG TPA: glycoside hydrolase family 43 protein [Acidimicrobiia bacterium]|nr:glycoside hydrolase family 43 protein [Acidimicrobiia bacterium]